MWTGEMIQAYKTMTDDGNPYELLIGRKELALMNTREWVGERLTSPRPYMVALCEQIARILNMREASNGK